MLEGGDWTKVLFGYKQNDRKIPLTTFEKILCKTNTMNDSILETAGFT